MGRKKTKYGGRLRRIAAGLAAAAAAVLPGMAATSAGPLAEAIEADVRTTPPARLLELANSHPEQVLANRALRRLRAQDPDAHRDIVLAARFARAEIALRQAMARVDPATRRVFACDCAARVAPLYETFGPGAALLERARAHAVAVAERGAAPEGATATAPRPANAFELAFAEAERDVDALEQEVMREALITHGATGALGQLFVARSEQRVSRLEDGVAADGAEPPFRMLAVAMIAAKAIDEAVLVAAGGSLGRIGTMCDAIAEAVYLDHVFRTGEPSGAIDAVFRELAWQRSHLRALRAEMG
jgi:hypothetical protein